MGVLMKKANIEDIDVAAAASEDSNIFGLNFTATESNVVLLPVPWEATVSYGRGTSHGPEAVRRASSQLDFFDAEFAELGLSRPWEFGIHLLPVSKGLETLHQSVVEFAHSIVDAGGAHSKKLLAALTEVNEASSRVNSITKSESAKWLDSGKIVGFIGGDHSTAFANIAACAERFPNLGVLHFDAHADLRAAYLGFEFAHASVMHNVVRKVDGVAKLVQVGIRDFCEEEHAMATTHPKIKTWFDFAIRRALFSGNNWADISSEIIESLPQEVYVSFDIDALDPSLCPHTGTPVAGGLSFAEASFLIVELAKSGRRIVGFDVNEVAPNPRNRTDEWDGNVGARILYKLCGAALYSNGART
jgi:agmatinase